VRAEDQRLCALVVMGVNERGQKHFLAIEDGVRASTQSWREVLLGLKARGLTEAPRLAVGDGALRRNAGISDLVFVVTESLSTASTLLGGCSIIASDDRPRLGDVRQK
jgi:hypothetical protein